MEKHSTLKTAEATMGYQREHMLNQLKKEETKTKEEDSVLIDCSQSEEVPPQKVQANEQIVPNLHSAALVLKVASEKTQLPTKIELICDAIAEAESGALAANASDNEDKLLFLSTEVDCNLTRSDVNHVFDKRSQLASQLNEAHILRRNAVLHRPDVGGLRPGMFMLAARKTNAEGMLSLLREKMHCAKEEQYDFDQQLIRAANNLESNQAEQDCCSQLKAANIEEMSVNQTQPDNSSIFSLHVENSSRDDVPDTSSLSWITEEGIQTLHVRMVQVKLLMSKDERERKLLRIEARHLKTDLKSARLELATAKRDNAKTSRQILALHNALETTEAEKNQLKLDLRLAQKKIAKIESSSSKPYNLITTQSQCKINKRRTELKNRNVMVTTRTMGSVACHSSNTELKYNTSSETATPNQNGNDNLNNFKFSSSNRLKVDKGAIFGVLKGMKKSGRREKVKYRNTTENT